MPKARLLLHRKRMHADGAISEVKLWLLDTPLEGSTHRLKYSLFFGDPGRRMVAYDNERGKGDHRHLNQAEAAYEFVSVARLLADFQADVRRVRAVEDYMDDGMTITVGGSLQEDLAAFQSAWERAERGEMVAPERVLAFDTWEALAAVLTGERFRLLRHLRAHPEPSISALARSLGRHLRRVQSDFRALEQAGLVDRSAGELHATAGRLSADIVL